MAFRVPIEIDEWYHCYNRGVDKRIVFNDDGDYERFLLLMYLCNGSTAIHASNLYNPSLAKVLLDSELDRGDRLVEFGCYVLMPNHFHFLLKEIQDGGVSVFMQRMFTAYAMYFNRRHDRTGALFAGPFKSKHVDEDRYLKQLIAYLHLNPAELFDPKWKQGTGNIKKIKQELLAYKYSSLLDFLRKRRPERKILGDTVFELFETMPALNELVSDADDYYAQTYDDW